MGLPWSTRDRRLVANVVQIRRQLWDAQVLAYYGDSTHRGVVVRRMHVEGRRGTEAMRIANALLALEEIKREEVMNGP